MGPTEWGRGPQREACVPQLFAPAARNAWRKYWPSLCMAPKQAGGQEPTLGEWSTDHEVFIAQVFEYRRLLKKRNLGTIGPTELDRFVALEARLTVSEHGVGWRFHKRTPVDVQATLETTAGIRRVRVTDLSGGGARVEPTRRLRQGETATLLIHTTARVYRFAVQARWHDDSQKMMGLPFANPRALTQRGHCPAQISRHLTIQRRLTTIRF